MEQKEMGEEDRNQNVERPAGKDGEDEGEEQPTSNKDVDEDDDESGSTGSAESVGSLLARKMRELTL